ncbi:sensor histidine kinase [Dyella sp. Tek66A03]|uniref:sensor histidine kinase n=1 Tax=Dyella sp. Tek66A03 TaxID=3458298 RepID=UPI00403E9CBC
MARKPFVATTGGSSGICDAYADRFARRGHDLVLVSRDRARMVALAERLHRETGAEVDVLQADLADADELARVEARLSEDVRIGILVSTAGTTAPGGLVEESPEAVLVFNTMQDRISRHLKEHLKILGSIAHDLQTPITRMRLRVEALEESAVQQKIVDDLREMEHLVREGVSYARSAHGGAEALVRIDPVTFLESLVFDYQDMGRPVTLSGTVGGRVMSRPQTLRRVLGNLIDNAVKYGGSAEVGAQRDAAGVLCITVSDRGPGIPDGKLEQVLQPFYRLAASRHSDTRGAGLGLAIAAQLISSIGGHLVLSNRDGGGLAATIALP